MNYLKRTLVEYLDHEIRSSCDCRLEVDRVELSLVTLSATARNPRIVTPQGIGLSFKRLKAEASLLGILDHVIPLSIELVRGNADGVDEESTTFKFIDYLVKPIPPERDHPGRWRIHLTDLKLVDSTFSQKFAAGTLYGSGLALNMNRTKLGNFVLYPSAKKLSFGFNSRQGEPPVLFGAAEGEMFIEGDTLNFTRVTLDRPGMKVEAQPKIHLDQKNRLSGPMKFNFKSAGFEGLEELDTEITGSMELGGNFASPKAEGSVLSSDVVLTHVLLPLKGAELTFKNVVADLSAGFDNGDGWFNFSALNAESEDASFVVTSPFGMGKGLIHGAINLSTRTLKSDSIQLEDLDLAVSFSGSLLEPKVISKGEVGFLQYGTIEVGPLSFDGSKIGDKINLNVEHNTPTRGSIALTTALSLANGLPQNIDELRFEVQSLDLVSGSNPSQRITLDGSGLITGPFDLSKLSGKGAMRVGVGALRDDNAISGDAVIQSGKVALNLAGAEGKVRLDGSIDLTAEDSNLLHFSLNQFPLSEYDPELDCLNLTVESSYQFKKSAWISGNGSIELHSGTVGCAPYTLNLTPTTYTIKSGQASGSLSLSGTGSQFRIEGTFDPFAGYNLQTKGVIQAEALLTFLPSLDDVAGSINADLKIVGGLDQPRFNGKALIQDGEFSVAAEELSGENISGELVFDQDKIELRSVSGEVNRGMVSLRGTLYPWELSRSSLDASANGVELAPISDTLVTAGGEFKLSSGPTGRALISGNAILESGELEKNFDIKLMVKMLGESIFASQAGVSPAGEVSSTTLAEIDLDLKLTGERNLLLLTNWASGELNANFTLTGTLAAPVIRGEMEILSGWFGVKDRRFSITNGKIIFSPNLNEPLMEVLAETEVRTLYGDNVLIFMEAKGPTSSPIIKLTSDREYSERELLSLVTSAYGVSSDLSVPSLLLTPISDESRKDDDSFVARVRRALESLTRIDEVSLEPSYNEQTGVVDPKIVAKKEITSELALIGEQTFRTDNSKSELRLRFDLTDKLAAVGRVTSEATQATTALGADLSYAIIPEREKLLDLSLQGIRTLEPTEVFRALRIDSSTRISAAEIEAISGRLKTLYQSKGYFESEVSIKCLKGNEICRSAVLSVNEGKASKIGAVTLQGDDIANVLKDLQFVNNAKGLRASQFRLDQVTKTLIQRLRSEGYVSARVSGAYQRINESSEYELRLNVSLGKPVSFVFKGNSHFTPEQLLESINLFDRKLPFGRNTIIILVQNIERAYRKDGYLYATIKYTENTTADGRVNYQVEIDEGAIVPVKVVRFEGSDAISPDDIKIQLSATEPTTAQQIFYPRFAVAEELEFNTSRVKSLFIEHGYPDVTVKYEIKELDTGGGVEVVYRVEQGDALLADWVELVDVPESVSLPEAPFAPYSVPKANRYVEGVIDALTDGGYFSAAVSSDLDPASSRLRYNISAGPQTKISRVIVSGNENIAEETILRYVQTPPGSGWVKRAIDRSRSELLRLGLFSRVELVPADGALDGESEELLIRVQERNLTSFEIGAGVDSEYGVHVFGVAGSKEIFKDGRDLELRLDGFYDPDISDISKGVASLRYTNPHLFNSQYRLTEDLRFQKLENTTQEFDLGRVSLASYLDRQWDDNLEITLGHTILFDDISNVEPDVVLSDLDFGNVRLSFLSGNVIYDRRDYVLNPTDGYLLAFDYKLASEAIGSDGNFAAATSRASWIRPLSSDHGLTFAANTKIGGAWGFAGTDQIPITQRFYLGGLNSIRGFRDNSLGPRGELGHVIGGDLLFANNWELRYRLSSNFALHTFFDAGTVFLQDQDPDLAEIRASAGVGFRYISPIGPIGFDLGHPLDEKEGEPSLRLHFTLGTTF